MDRVVQLEQVQAKHDTTLYGDGDEKPGLTGEFRMVRWWLKIIAAGVGVVLATILAKWTETKMGPAQQNVSQTVGTGNDSTMPATEYDTKQLASLMGYSIREIQDRAARGEIAGARKDGKEWRFDKAAVDAALAAKAAAAASAAKDAK